MYAYGKETTKREREKDALLCFGFSSACSDDYRRSRPLRIYCDVVRDDAAIIPLRPPGLHPLGRNDWKNIPQYLDVHLSLLCLSAPGEMWDKRSVGEKVRLWAETHAADGPETRSEYWAWQSSPRGLPGRRGSGAKLHGQVFPASRVSIGCSSQYVTGDELAQSCRSVTESIRVCLGFGRLLSWIFMAQGFLCCSDWKKISPFLPVYFWHQLSKLIFLYLEQLWSSYRKFLLRDKFFVIWHSWPWMIHARSKNFSKKCDKKHVCRWLKTLCFKQST